MATPLDYAIERKAEILNELIAFARAARGAPAPFEAHAALLRRTIAQTIFPEPGDEEAALGDALRAIEMVEASLPAALPVSFRVAAELVKARLGGRLRVANAGGAPLSRDIAEFFHAIDILILEGYGLSEVTTAATVLATAINRFAPSATTTIRKLSPPAVAVFSEGLFTASSPKCSFPER